VRVHGRGRGYRRRAGCAPAGALAASGGRTQEDRCPTWYGGQFCTGSDVDAWWLALESRKPVVESVINAGAPSAEDEDRISRWYELLEEADTELAQAVAVAGNVTAIGSFWGEVQVAKLVDRLIAAVDASYCVTEGWQGLEESWTPPGPAKGSAVGGGISKAGGGSLAQFASSRLAIFAGGMALAVAAMLAWRRP